MTGEIAFISANFDVGVSCSSIFVFKVIGILPLAPSKIVFHLKLMQRKH